MQKVMKMPIESLNLLMLNMGYAKHDGDWNWKNVQSPFTRIFLVTEGSAMLHSEGGATKLTPNHMYIIPAGTLHSYECTGVFTLYYIHIYEGFKNETDVFNRYIFPIEVEADDSDRMIMELLCRNNPEAQLPASNPMSYDNATTFRHNLTRYNNMPLHQRMLIRGGVLILFSRFLALAQPRLWTTDKRMTRVLQYIHNNLYDDLNIDILSEVACITKFHLIRLFKRSFGVSPLQYINKKKMEKAQLLLLTGDQTVKELAFSLGFSSPAYFSRMFKQITGYTPQEYRRNCK